MESGKLLRLWFLSLHALLILGLLFVLVLPVNAAHTFDGKAAVNNSVTNPVTLSYTAGSGSTLLAITIVTDSAIARTGSAPTFNGTSGQTNYTLVKAGTTQVPGAEVTSELWYLTTTLPTTAYTIIVPNDGFLALTVNAFTFKAQTGYYSALDNVSGSTVTAANPYLLLTTTTDGDAVVNVLGSGDSSIPTAYSHTEGYGYDMGFQTANTQYTVQTTAGLINMNWTIALSDDVANVIAAWKEVSLSAMPPSPINLANTTGNFWVNHTWSPGVGNVTTSYNVSVNGTWYNGTTNLFYNNSCGVSGCWSNVSVYAWNGSGLGTLNLTPISQNTQAPITYIPPIPTNLQNTTGSFWVNHTWSAGTGNITDSYNVSVNGVWYNGTTNTFYNNNVSWSGWSNITVWAYNDSALGKLSTGNVSQETQAPFASPLTFNSKYVINSSTEVTTTSETLVDDIYANQSFTLTEPKTVLIIYNPHNIYGSSEYSWGKQIAINVDATNYSNTWNSGDGYSGNIANGLTTFWIGNLSSGSHNVKGMFASNLAGNTVTINERVLIILIFNGNGFWFVDNATTVPSYTDTFINDTYANQTFTTSTASKALILYNTGVNPSTGTIEGKKIAINLEGIDYSQAEKSTTNTGRRSENVFTFHYTELSASSYTVKGRFAGNLPLEVYVDRRQFGMLLLDNSTLGNYITSDTQVSTSLEYPTDDMQSTINRTTSDTRELFVLAMGTKRYATSSNETGEAYGIKVDTNDRAKSRGSPELAEQANSMSTAWVEQLTAGSHTIQGRFGNNLAGATAKIDSRRVVGLWFVTEAAPPDTTFTVSLPVGYTYAWFDLSGYWNASTMKNATPLGQTSSQCFYNVTNTGNTNLNIRMRLNSTIANLVFKGDSDNDPAGAKEINDTDYVILYTGLGQGNSVCIWLWSDLSNTVSQDTNKTAEVNVTQT